MKHMRVDRYECNMCLLVTPFTYAKCLNGILSNKQPTLCESKNEKILSTARFRLGEGVKLTDIIRDILIQTGPITKKRLVELIPEYSSGSIGYALSSMPDVVSRRVPKKRWSVFSLEN